MSITAGALETDKPAACRAVCRFARQTGTSGIPYTPPSRPTGQKDNAERPFGHDGHSIGGHKGVERGRCEDPQRAADKVNDPRCNDSGSDDAREQV